MRASLFLIAVASIGLVSCTPRPKPPEIVGGIAVAKVGDQIITDKDLMNRVEAIEKNFPRTYATHPQKKQLLEEMIHIELLYRQAVALGLDKRYEFKSRLADLYIQQLAEQARSKISDRELKEEFESNKDQYQQVSARHILLRTEAKMDSAAKQGILKNIQSLRAEAMKNPDHFQDLAKTNSQDGSASNGGELGFFNPGMMVAPFSKAAFALKKVGDISDVVETQFGYHIIQLTGDHRSFDFHKDLIRDRLTRKTQRARLEEMLADLKKQTSTQIFEDNLAKLSPLPKDVNTPPETLVPDEPESKKTP